MANDVPLYVGEFGSMPDAPGDSRTNLVRDKIGVMNAAGLHWALWTFRDTWRPAFGLYHDGDLDERLYEVLCQGLKGRRVCLPFVAKAGDAPGVSTSVRDLTLLDADTGEPLWYHDPLAHGDVLNRGYQEQPGDPDS